VLVEGGQDGAEFKAAQQVSFLVDSLDDLRATRERVTNTGTEIASTTTHGNAWSIYFRDPDDNRIEVYTHTPWHVPQPHGHDFDLSQSNEEIMKLTEAHCREDPGFMLAGEREKAMAKVMASAD
jgi:catechol-2,3-dioxygenase